MRLNERTVAVLVSDEGQNALQGAAVNLPPTSVFLVYVQDSDDMGLWVRTPREDGDHLLLIRWEYVLTIDFPVGETKTIGLTR